MDEFTPPRCPHLGCTNHRDPTAGWYKPHGTYRAKCRSQPIPRYRCRGCRRSFSYQTFRADYRDRRPECNARLFLLLASGVGLRQSGRNLDLDVHAVQKKFRKIACQLWRLNRNLLRQLPAGCTFLLDEFETFECCDFLPLTIPVLIEKRSMLVVAAGTGSIRRAGRRGSKRRRRLERYEAVHGMRKDESRRCLHKLMRRWQRLLAGKSAELVSDEKPVYGSLCRLVFGSQVEHRTHSGRLPRTRFNPLFRINLTEKMLRDNCARLAVDSWKHSKKKFCMRLQMELFDAYRNWHRPRTNDDPQEFTPGVALQLIERRLMPEEMLSWRQDWEERSGHPASARGLPLQPSR